MKQNYKKIRLYAHSSDFIQCYIVNIESSFNFGLWNYLRLCLAYTTATLPHFQLGKNMKFIFSLNE